MSTMVRRLTRRWEEKREFLAEDPFYTHSKEARWWINAIADEVGDLSKRGHDQLEGFHVATDVIADWLRAQAQEGEE